MRFSLAIYFILLVFLTGCDRVTDSENPDDSLPPAQPYNVYVYSAYDGVIVLEWNNNTEPDLAGYIIYRSETDTSGFKKIITTNGNYFIDDSLEYNIEYFYKISAVDQSGRESKFSLVVSARPVNRYSPLTPIYLEINARNWGTDVSIFLSWEQAEESDVTGYNIYRSRQANFTADSTSLLAFSPTNNFIDRDSLEFYIQYYYKIKAVDKGGLQSKASSQITDILFKTPVLILPVDNSNTEYFKSFLVKAVNHAATYKIILQTNQYFGEIWSKEVYSTVENDTIAILFDASYIYAGRKYYWRVATYSGYSSDPNSISELHSFIIKD